MATYVVGDVQGCFLSFQKLLRVISFNPKDDRIILVGDAINRGPRSLEMLEYIKINSSCMDLILGNHEIFAIALMLKAIKNTRPHTLKSLLEAPNRDELFAFLRARPLIIKEDNNIFVHAGILPKDSVDEAIKKAQAISDILKDNRAKKFLERFWQKMEHKDEPSMGSKRALRLVLAYLTLLRMCDSESSMNLSYTGGLEKAPKGLKPWFQLRNDKNLNIYFGHWAALGLYSYKNYHCLDSGCAWGLKLSAIRLSDRQIFQVDNADG